MTQHMFTDIDANAVLLGTGPVEPGLVGLVTAVSWLRETLTPATVRPSAELTTWFEGTAAVLPPVTPEPAVVPLLSRVAVKVAFGAMVAVAGLGGGAAAGMLPAPVQHLYDELVHRLGRGDTGPTGDARSGDWHDPVLREAPASTPADQPTAQPMNYGTHATVPAPAEAYVRPPGEDRTDLTEVGNAGRDDGMKSSGSDEDSRGGSVSDETWDDDAEATDAGSDDAGVPDEDDATPSPSPAQGADEESTGDLGPPED